MTEATVHGMHKPSHIQHGAVLQLSFSPIDVKSISRYARHQRIKEKAVEKNLLWAYLAVVKFSLLDVLGTGRG